MQNTGLIPGWEDHLEKEMAIHFSILAWEILWTEKYAGCSPWACERVRHYLAAEQQSRAGRASLLGVAKKTWTRLRDLTRLTKAFMDNDTCKEI